MKTLLRKLSVIAQFVAAVTLVAAHNLLALGGFNTVPLALYADGDPDDVKDVNRQLLAGLKDIGNRLKEIDEVKKSVGEHKTTIEGATKALEEVQRQVLAFQKQMTSIRSARVRRGGEVSLECAKYLGAIGLIAGIRQEKIVGEQVTRAGTHIKSILDIDVTKSLSTAEIPLPEQYAAEVVELVSEYGQARRVGTVYPLGAGTVKLPKLKTSPAFGLLAIATQIGEKKPAFEFVTFTAEKWGGIVILPTEIDEDSIVALGQFIARYSAREMAKIEDVVFFAADGTATYALLKGVLLNQDAAATRVVLANTKTKVSDLTLANVRAMRAKVASAALARGKYYFHPSFEQLFSTFNAAGDKPYLANGVNGASIDGFAIEWIDTLPPYSEDADAGTVFGAFGDMSYSYLAPRGGMRFDTSREFLFDTDQMAVRAVERFTVGHMAADHVAVVKTAAA